MMIDPLDGLNEAQAEAVEQTSGALLINAGPGSGKTRVLTARIARLVIAEDIPADRICAMTFTNRAAREMKNRMISLIGTDVARLSMGTFHSFCARLLRRFGERIGIPRDFVIYDETDTKQTMKRIMREMLDEKPDPAQVGAAVNAISRAKNMGRTSEEFSIENRNDPVADCYAAYERRLWLSDALDFDDLLTRTLYMLDESPPIERSLALRYAHVMIDEFQDASALQYEIARRLASIHGNLCAVGDPDQSIYGWRQADIRNFERLKSEFPDAREILLETNYRSTDRILGAASALMSRAEPARGYERKALRSVKAGGRRIELAEFPDEDAEARAAVGMAMRIMDRRGPGSVAICYRANSQSRALEAVCAEMGVPCRVMGGLKFYQRAEVKDVCAYLRLIVDPHDDASFVRVVNTPRRGVGAASVGRLLDASREAGVSAYDAAADPDLLESAGLPKKAARSLTGFVGLMDHLRRESEDQKSTLSALVEETLEQTGYMDHLAASNDERAGDRMENVQELTAQAERHESAEGAARALGEFLESASLMTDEDREEELSDRLILSTIHQTKGMEWPAVIIVGLNEGTLPHQRSIDDEDVEEERRLLYVGMTRAMEELHLFRPLKRRMNGNRKQVQSRFVRDLNPHP